MIENIYNKWQLQDIDLGNTEPYQFTKSELINYAEFYHENKVNNTIEKVKFYCVDEQYKGISKCKNECFFCSVAFNNK